MSDEQKQAYTEVLTILKYMEPKQQERIPKKLMNFFRENMDEDYRFELNTQIPLKKQKLKSRTLSLLAMLNFNYWCDTEKEKEQLMKLYYENEKKYQDALTQKYSVDKMFMKQNEKENIQKENQITKYNQNIFTKIINKIKMFFLKK